MMQDAFKSVPFDHDGLSYEVRVTRNEWGYRAKVFRDGRPAAPWTYSASYEEASDFEQDYGDAVEALVASAKDDVTSGRQTKMLKFLREQHDAKKKSAAV